MRERLVPKNEARLIPEDVALWADLVLLLTSYLDRADGDDLASLGKRSRDDFVNEAIGLIERIN